MTTPAFCARQVWRASRVKRKDSFFRSSSSMQKIRSFSSRFDQGVTANGSSAVYWPTTIAADSSRRAFSSSPLQADDDSLHESSEQPVKVTKAEEYHEETKRRRLSDVLISEVLKAKHSYRWIDPVISKTATVADGITATIEGGLSGMMVLEPDRNSCVGLITSRDLLRIMAAGLRDETPAEDIMNRCIGDYMTPISQVIFARPEETIGVCRTIMAKLGIKCLPVLSREGTVEGLITARDMSDFGLSASDKGGKKSYLNDVSERVGLSSDTSMAEPPTYLRAHLGLDNVPLYVNVGHGALPHPFKGQGGQRDPRFGEYPTDLSLSEDASFCTTVSLPDGKDGTLRSFTYLGVADGVGSWREYDVDPREFSRRLMEECENILHEAADKRDSHKFHQVISPAEIMAQAHERVKAENTIGSSTACVALFDGTRHQLHFSNLGDSGLIVLRHIDSHIAGALKRDQTPREERTSDLRLAYVSQQQLLAFNHPFQLGWTGEIIEKSEHTSFKSAKDSCTTSFHLRRGDIIIVATDGLFDNLELDEICAMALEWEQHNGFIRGGDITARERRWSMGNSLTGVSAEKISDLAMTLCEKAREKSLDRDTDSPFAILAKENDIMWSGGMPDDTTVLAVHVVGRDANDHMDKTGM